MVEVGKARLRIARATDRMDEIVAFYRDGLGFEVIGSFEDHDGFDGVMLGLSDSIYHLEFTHHRGHSAGKAPSLECLLVFYLPKDNDWRAAVSRMRERGYNPVNSYNPYWDRLGITFEDADGYRVVLQRSSWP